MRQASLETRGMAGAYARHPAQTMYSIEVNNSARDHARPPARPPARCHNTDRGKVEHKSVEACETECAVKKECWGCTPSYNFWLTVKEWCGDCNTQVPGDQLCEYGGTSRGELRPLAVLARVRAQC